MISRNSNKSIRHQFKSKRDFTNDINISHSHFFVPAPVWEADQQWLCLYPPVALKNHVPEYACIITYCFIALMTTPQFGYKTQFLMCFVKVEPTFTYYRPMTWVLSLVCKLLEILLMLNHQVCFFYFSSETQKAKKGFPRWIWHVIEKQPSLWQQTVVATATGYRT